MKILFYINTLGKGGAERVVTNLANQFADENNTIILVTSYKVEKEYKTNSNVKRICLEDYKKSSKNKIFKNINIIRQLKKIICMKKPDLVVSFMREPVVRALLASRKLDVKNIISIRNDPSKEYPGITGKLISKYILPKADGCVFQTEDAKKYFPIKLQGKSKIIFNQVDEKFFDVNIYDPKYIVSIGRLSHQKNQMMLINAFAKVNEKYPDEKLLIYGDGELKEKLKNEINKKGLEDRILLMGLTDNIPKVLSKAKMFILSSDYEGMPNTLLEAMAAGVPCISTDCPCGGPKAIINHGVDGILVPVNNKKELAKNILLLLEDNELSNEIRRNAKEKSEIFKPNNIFKQWQEYFEQVINN